MFGLRLAKAFVERHANRSAMPCAPLAAGRTLVSTRVLWGVRNQQNGEKFRQRFMYKNI